MKAAAAPADPVLVIGEDALPTKGKGDGLAWPRVGKVPLIPLPPPVTDGTITPGDVPVAVGETPVTNPVPLLIRRPVPEGRTPVPVPVPVGRGKPVAVPLGRKPVGMAKPPVGNTKLPRTGVSCCGSSATTTAAAASSTMLAKCSPMLRK